MAARALVEYEAGQTPFPFEALDDSGDRIHFAASVAPWSDAPGFEPVVAPYGLLTGGAVTATGTVNQVSVAALTASMAGSTAANSNGVVVRESAGTLLAVRSDDAGTPNRITSLTVDEAGELAAEPGIQGASFTENRGVAGGPPLIPAGSIEIGQVRLVGLTDAVVQANEILTVPGLHVERADYPVYQIDYARGWVVFATALPPIHASNEPKKVYVKGATPLFAPVSNASDWVPAESTYSITSDETYDGPVGSASSSLGQASFTALLKDGMSDPIVMQKGKRLWFKFRPNRDATYPYQITQGLLGISRTFPAGGGSISASCTVTPSTESLDVREV